MVLHWLCVAMRIPLVAFMLYSLQDPFHTMLIVEGLGLFAFFLLPWCNRRPSKMKQPRSKKTKLVFFVYDGGVQRPFQRHISTHHRLTPGSTPPLHLVSSHGHRIG